MIENCIVCNREINTDLDPHFRNDFTGELICSLECILDASDLVKVNDDLDIRCPNMKCKSSTPSISYDWGVEIDGDASEQVSCTCNHCGTTWVMHRSLVFTGISDVCVPEEEV